MRKNEIILSSFIFLVFLSGCAPTELLSPEESTPKPGVEPSLEIPTAENESPTEPHTIPPEERNEPESISDEEHIVSILKRTKENLRAKGIDCSFENDHTTKNSLAIDPYHSNILYVGIEGKGIYKSVDGGGTWSKKSKGIIAYPDEINIRQLCPPDPNRIVIDPTNTQRLLLSPGDISTGYVDWPYGETGGIWESLDGAESWHQILKENLNAAGTALAIDQQNPLVIYYGVNSDPATFKEAPIQESLNKRGVVYKTMDGGDTWKEIDTGMIPGLQASGIFVDPQNSQNIILLTQAHYHEYGENYIKEIFSYEQFGPMKSIDGGKTWTTLAANLPVPFRNPFDGDVAAANFNHIIVRPFLFGEEFPPEVQQKSFYSTDGGNTFKETSTYINIGRYSLHDQEGNNLLGYAPWHADGDIVESRDAGATWKPLGQAAEIDNTKVKVTNFVWDPKDKNVVYMTGTQGYVWKSVDSGKSWTVVLSLERLSE